MRVSLFSAKSDVPLDEHIADVRAAAAAGMDGMYFGQVSAWDAVTLAAACAREVPGIDVGVAVTQTFNRHPLVLAGQALTAQALSGNRFTLGVGPSHPMVIEGMYGIPYERPAQHTREYLQALRSLLSGADTTYRGERITAVGRLAIPGAEPPSVLLSALGPVMLGLAGELADGTATVRTGPKLLAEHIVPIVTRAAERAGRPAPRIVSAVLVSLTRDPDGVRRQLAEQYALASNLPAYQAVLERQGMSGVEETLLAGDENTIIDGLRAYADAGATEVMVGTFGDDVHHRRVLELLTMIRP